jgi:hypothetical protein
MPTNYDDPELMLEESYGGSATAVQTEEPTFDFVDWENRVQKAAKADTDVRWELGDLLVEGEPHFWKEPDQHDLNPLQGEGFYVFAEGITGLSNGHLRDLASTAKRVPVSVRTDELTWSHHRVLANNRPKEKGQSQSQYEDALRTWLAKAVDERMTVAKFREATAIPGKKPNLERSFLVTVPLCVWEALKDIAEDRSEDQDTAEEVTVGQVAANILVEFAASDDGMAAREIAKNQNEERLYQKRAKNGRKVARNYDPLGLRREHINNE